MNTKLTRVLLIEDNPGDARLVREMLKEAAAGQHNLDCADRLSAGLDYLAEQHPDIVLLDLGLPDSQGLNTLARVSALAAGIPVVVLTGLDDEAVGIEAMRQGAQDYLVKGHINGRALQRVINYAVERKRAEEAIKESEQRLKEAQKLGRIGDWEFDLVTQKIVWSDEVYELYERDKAQGPPSVKEEALYYTPEEAARLREFTRLAAEKGQELQYEVTAKVPSGKTLFLHCTMRPVKDAKGRVVKLFGTVQDITERKKTEEQLRIAEQNFRNSLDNSPLGIRVAAADGGLLYANKAFLDIYGCSSVEELEAIPTKQRYTPESYAEFLKRQEARRLGQPLPGNYRMDVVRKDGEIRHLNVYRREVIWNGEVVFQGICEDITERKKMEDQLRAAEQNFRNSLDSSPLGIRIATQDGKLLYANKAMLDIYGYSSVEELLATPAERRFTPESYAGHLKRIEARRLGQPIPSNYGFSIVRKDGEIRHLNVFRKEVIWNGEVQSQGVYEDTTERVKAEEEIQRNYQVQTVLNKLMSLSLETTSQEELFECTIDYLTSLSWLTLEKRGAMFLVEDDPQVLMMKAQRGLPTPLLATCARVPFGRCMCGRAALSGKVEFADRVDERHEIRYEGISPHGHYCVPLVSAGKVLGVINLYVKKGHRRNEREEEFLHTVADVLVGVIKRKQAEEQLRIAEQNFRNSLDNSPLGIRIGTPGGAVLYCNKALLDTYGYSSVEELEAIPTKQRLTPESYAKYLKRIEAVRLGQPIPSNYKSSIVRKDGQIRHLNVFRREVIWNGETHFQGICEDITERKKTEEEFRRISAFNQSLLDSLPFGMHIVDEKGTLLYLSKRLESLVGKEAVGKKCWSIFKDNRKQCDNCPLKEEIKIGEVKSLEIESALAGRTFFSTNIGIMYQGEKALLAIFNDITERKQAEQSLSAKTTELAKRVQELEGVNRLNVQILNERVKTGEELLQRNKELEILMAITHSMAQLQEPDKILQVALDKVLAFLELKRGFTALLDEEKNKFSFLCHRDFSPAMAQQLGQASPDQGFIGLALRGTQPIMIEDIGTRPIEVQSQVGPEPGPHSLIIAVLKAREKVLGVLGVSSTRQRLFTDREKDLLTAIAGQIGIALDNSHLFQQTRQSEEKYRQLVDNLHEGIWVIDKDSCTTFVNPSMTEMLGYKTDEMLGRHLFSFMDEGGVKLATQLLARRKEGVKEQQEFEFLRKDGTRVYVILETSPITDKDGNYIGAIAGVQDITGRRKMEEQLIMQDRLASIGQLASGIAHELNNPLTAVIGFSEMLLERDLPEDVKEDLETVNREAKRTANVVKGLLTFVRKQGTAKALVDFNGTIQGVLQLRSYEQKVSNIEVNARFAPDLPQVMGNGSQLQQVFINIIVNAEQAMLEAHGRGKLTITTERVGDIVRASITDDGPGISPENMRKLFSPFFTTKEVGKGTGLGLSICHGIVTEHGGKIYAESEPAKGATFVVELPISK